MTFLRQNIKFCHPLNYVEHNSLYISKAEICMGNIPEESFDVYPQFFVIELITSYSVFIQNIMQQLAHAN